VTGDEITDAAARKASEIYNGALVRGTARSKPAITRAEQLGHG
jgi:hypothetical protein